MLSRLWQTFEKRSHILPSCLTTWGKLNLVTSLLVTHPMRKQHGQWGPMTLSCAAVQNSRKLSNGVGGRCLWDSEHKDTLMNEQARKAQISWVRRILSASPAPIVLYITWPPRVSTNLGLHCNACTVSPSPGKQPLVRCCWNAAAAPSHGREARLYSALRHKQASAMFSVLPYSERPVSSLEVPWPQPCRQQVHFKSSGLPPSHTRFSPLTPACSQRCVNKGFPWKSPQSPSSPLCHMLRCWLLEMPHRKANKRLLVLV